MENRYFSAVIDLEDTYGTFNEIKKHKDVMEERYFNNKFVDTPEKALAVACDVLNQRNHSDVTMEDIMKDVTFDAETNEYVIVKMFTSNYNVPTEHQMDRFVNKEPGFRFHKVIYKIQVFETKLITDNLINKVKDLEFPQKTK